MLIIFSFEYGIHSPLRLDDLGYPENLIFEELVTLKIGVQQVVNLRNVWISKGDNRIVIIDFIPVELSKLMIQLNSMYLSTYNDSYPPDGRFRDKTELEAFIEGVEYVVKELDVILKENHISFKNLISNKTFQDLDPTTPNVFN